MNPCHNRREEIALLASNPGESAQAKSTRSHLDTCEGCRHYFAELGSLHESHITAALNLPNAELPARTYRYVAAAIRIPAPTAITILAHYMRHWRMPLVTAGLSVVAFLILFRPAPSSTVLVPKTVATAYIATDDTRLSSYSRALAQSPEAFDGLLARSAANTSTPSDTSLLSWRNAPDYDL